MSVVSNLENGSTRQVVNEIKTILRSDETMMRLLTKLPKDNEYNRPDPLDLNLDCVVTEPSTKYTKPRNCKVYTYDCKSLYSETEKVEYWKLVDEHIFTKTKSTKIEELILCRIYIYTGRRRPVFASDFLTHQELVVSVFVHDEYANDGRMERINERLYSLLALRRIDGTIGTLNYKAGNPRHAPIGYQHFEHAFIYTTKKEGYSE